MCNTPTYYDLGKAAKDVFNKGYGFGMVKIDLRTKSCSGVEFSTSGHCIHVNPNLSIHHTTTPNARRFPPLVSIRSLHLCLNFCPANLFICTIFLGSTYMC
uniref:Voltage-dependent anion-selective channel protein 3 n=1 Tax=Phocoena sinus TaxID=42100 RepID=A0A8C9AXY8_PHOSS